jgi:hypothetical protein
VNAVEVYYRVERDHGRAEADQVLSGMRKVFELDLPGTVLMVETARLKAAMPIALRRSSPGTCRARSRTCAARDLHLGDPQTRKVMFWVTTASLGSILARAVAAARPAIRRGGTDRDPRYAMGRAGRCACSGSFAI